MIKFLILFLGTSLTALGQQLMEGQVLDKETSDPIPFASVGIVGTSRGTSTNLDGKFSLAITGGAILRVTCIGYESLEMNSSEAQRILLKPLPTQLNAVVVFSKEINPKKVVRKAFAAVAANYDSQPFLQKFFYRHYCMDNFVYGRLIEAFVDVWKYQGYKFAQKAVSTKEEIRVTQLRRSLDNTVMSQGHEPMSIGYVLQSDIVGYQTPVRSPHVSFYTDVSNLKTDIENYTFSFSGVTNYDGKDVYEIDYEYKKDSAQTTSGYLKLTEVTGSLFIAMDTYAILKTEEFKTFGKNMTKTSVYYRAYEGKYYPYHLIRDGENQSADESKHSFHVELMSVEIKKGEAEKVIGEPPVKEELLKIKYDSVFWSTNSILKTTPLEDFIIHDLGGGASLNKQFDLYHQFELNTSKGGEQGELKFNWLRDYSKKKKILFVTFIKANCSTYLTELEYVKRLSNEYRGKITFVILCFEKNEEVWQKTITKYNLFSDGIINYRIEEDAVLLKLFQLKEMPNFVLIDKNGVTEMNTLKPSNPLLAQNLNTLLGIVK
jgi:hypothetical protein